MAFSLRRFDRIVVAAMRWRHDEKNFGAILDEETGWKEVLWKAGGRIPDVDAIDPVNKEIL